MKFYICKHCGNIISYEKNSGVSVMCCGEKMSEIVPSSTDAAVEKHVPVIVQEGNNVKVLVGDIEHPMTDEHYIEWIVLETESCVYKKKLNPIDKPCCEFIVNENVVNAYAYCNLHGLWSNE